MSSLRLGMGSLSFLYLMPSTEIGTENEMMHFVGVLVSLRFQVLCSFMTLEFSHDHMTFFGQWDVSKHHTSKGIISTWDLGLTLLEGRHFHKRKPCLTSRKMKDDRKRERERRERTIPEDGWKLLGNHQWWIQKSTGKIATYLRVKTSIQFKLILEF